MMGRFARLKPRGSRFPVPPDSPAALLALAPAPSGVWESNPLAGDGTWTGDDGRKWRTECNTDNTGYPSVLNADYTLTNCTGLPISTGVCTEQLTGVPPTPTEVHTTLPFSYFPQLVVRVWGPMGAVTATETVAAGCNPTMAECSRFRVDIPDLLFGKENAGVDDTLDDDAAGASGSTAVRTKAPAFGLVLMLLLLPFLLIALNTVVGTLRTDGRIAEDAAWASGLQLIGQTPKKVMRREGQLSFSFKTESSLFG